MYTVRPLEPEEYEAFFRLVAIEFVRDVDPDIVASNMFAQFEDSPGFQPRQLRGVFEGDTFVGGCILHERDLSLYPSSVGCTCIGAVVTVPEHRMKGVGRALMEDSMTYSRSIGHGILLLNGIPSYYQRFGYSDVLELTYGAMKVEDVTALGPGPYRIRGATEEDAEACHELYQRYQVPYTGSFRWTIAHWRHRLKHRLRWQRCYLALDPSDRVQGYLFVSPQTNPRYATENVVADWQAAHTLIQKHAQIAGTVGWEELFWQIPPHADILYKLSDHVQIRCETTYTPQSGWMARSVHIPTLLQVLLPVWQYRWQKAKAAWSGRFTLAVDEKMCTLDCAHQSLECLPEVDATATVVRLRSGAFIQLVFGYRPISWYAQQSDVTIPVEMAPILHILFPPDHGFVPGTDHF